MANLSGKTAIVTGAAQGLGQAFAERLAAEGAAVAICDIRPEVVGVGDAIAARDGAVLSRVFDIANRTACETFVRDTVARFGGVDILVNNAALMLEVLRMRTSTISVEDWNQVLSVNLTGALLCSQAVIPIMRERGWGRIVNQLSSGAFPAQGVYGISKLALMGLTTALAQEVGRSGITVNAIAPGITDSGAGLTLRQNPTRYFEILQETVALRVRGQPDELTGALLYLCSEAGSWTTGQVLHVDGGTVIRP